MAVDQTGKQRRLGTVVDNLRAIRRRLDPTYLDDATVVTDEDLAVLANCRAVEDPAGAQNSHSR